ncbi:hypothetical protein CUMW_252700, partial [Citrus unshiu]
EGQRPQQGKDQLSLEVEDQQYWEEEAQTLVPLQKHAPQLLPPASHPKEPPPALAHPAPYLPGRPQPYISPPQPLACSCRARAESNPVVILGIQSIVHISGFAFLLSQLVTQGFDLSLKGGPQITLIPRWKRRRSVPRLPIDLRTLVGSFLPTTLTWGGGGRAETGALEGPALAFFGGGGGGLLKLLEARPRFLLIALRILLSIPTAISTKPEPTKFVGDRRSWQVDAFTRAVST